MKADDSEDLLEEKVAFWKKIIEVLKKGSNKKGTSRKISPMKKLGWMIKI